MARRRGGVVAGRAHGAEGGVGLAGVEALRPPRARRRRPAGRRPTTPAPAAVSASRCPPPRGAEALDRRRRAAASCTAVELGRRWPARGTTGTRASPSPAARCPSSTAASRAGRSGWPAAGVVVEEPLVGDEQDGHGHDVPARYRARPAPAVGADGAGLDVVRLGDRRRRSASGRGGATRASRTSTSATAAGAAARVGAAARLDRAGRAGLHEACSPRALGPAEAQAFLLAGFEVHERLHLLGPRPATTSPTRPPAAPAPRPAAPTAPAVLAVDAAAFPAFWRLDDAGLDEALAATPSARFRVAAGAVDATGGRRLRRHRAGRARAASCSASPSIPTRQGAGLGRALVLDGLRWLRRRGVDEVRGEHPGGQRAGRARSTSGSASAPQPGPGRAPRSPCVERGRAEAAPSAVALARGGRRSCLALARPGAAPTAAPPRPAPPSIELVDADDAGRRRAAPSSRDPPRRPPADGSVRVDAPRPGPHPLGVRPVARGRGPAQPVVFTDGDRRSPTSRRSPTAPACRARRSTRRRASCRSTTEGVYPVALDARDDAGGVDLDQPRHPPRRPAGRGGRRPRPRRRGARRVDARPRCSPTARSTLPTATRRPAAARRRRSARRPTCRPRLVVRPPRPLDGARRRRPIPAVAALVAALRTAATGRTGARRALRAGRPRRAAWPTPGSPTSSAASDRGAADVLDDDPRRRAPDAPVRRADPTLGADGLSRAGRRRGRPCSSSPRPTSSRSTTGSSRSPRPALRGRGPERRRHADGDTPGADPGACRPTHGRRAASRRRRPGWSCSRLLADLAVIRLERRASPASSVVRLDDPAWTPRPCSAARGPRRSAAPVDAVVARRRRSTHGRTGARRRRQPRSSARLVPGRPSRISDRDRRRGHRRPAPTLDTFATARRARRAPCPTCRRRHLLRATAAGPRRDERAAPTSMPPARRWTASPARCPRPPTVTAHPHRPRGHDPADHPQRLRRPADGADPPQQRRSSSSPTATRSIGALTEETHPHRHPRCGPAPPARSRSASTSAPPTAGRAWRRAATRCGPPRSPASGSSCRSAPACSSSCGGPATGAAPAAAEKLIADRAPRPPDRGRRRDRRRRSTRFAAHARPHRHRQRLRPHRRGAWPTARHRGRAADRSASATRSSSTATS